MVKYKVTHKYRDCTVTITPEDEFLNLTIHDDLMCSVIREECFSIDTPLTTKQVVTECELFIDNYIEEIESIGNVK